MKLKWVQLIVITIVILIGLAALAITNIPDSPIEQAAEAVLKTQGIDIDFSPDEQADNQTCDGDANGLEEVDQKA